MHDKCIFFVAVIRDRVSINHLSVTENFRHGCCDNFRMNTGYGRYGAAYNMVGLLCFNEELSLLPKNPTEAKLQATSTRGESTEPTKGVMKPTYKSYYTIIA
jgi:hypothetical protein